MTIEALMWLVIAGSIIFRVEGSMTPFEVNALWIGLGIMSAVMNLKSNEGKDKENDKL